MRDCKRNNFRRGCIFTPAWIANKNFFFYLEKEEEEEEEEEVSQEEKENVKLHALVSVFQFIMKQSYICALIAMMVSTGNKNNNAIDFTKVSTPCFSESSLMGWFSASLCIRLKKYQDGVCIILRPF